MEQGVVVALAWGAWVMDWFVPLRLSPRLHVLASASQLCVAIWISIIGSTASWILAWIALGVSVVAWRGAQTYHDANTIDPVALLHARNAWYVRSLAAWLASLVAAAVITSETNATRVDPPGGFIAAESLALLVVVAAQGCISPNAQADRDVQRDYSHESRGCCAEWVAWFRARGVESGG